MSVIYEDLLKDKRHIHFIGIGGSGMFPLAQILHDKGYYITGSDNNETDTLKLVRSLGIPVFFGHDPKNIEGADLIVHTAAIMKDNVELVAAKASSARVVERSVLLGSISRKYSNAVCVCGTHGKTTSTAMLTQLLMDCGADPTAIIGGRLPSIDSNGRVGASDTLVVESCEYVDTFLKLSPDISVVLNIDEDHLEYFKNLDNIIRSFNTFNKMASKMVIVNGDDQNAMRSLDGVEKPIVTCGEGEDCEYRAVDVTCKNNVFFEYDLYHRQARLCHISLGVPGRHNVHNSLLVCAAALQCGVTPSQLEEHIGNFRGAGRRFEFLGEVNGFTVADDYAHHPAELEATLSTAMQMGYRQVWAVFQPFTYSRTSILLDDFARVLSMPDRAVITEIMGAREINTYGIKATDLSSKIPGSVQLDTFEQVADYVLKNAQPGDLVLTLGCGDVYKIAKLLLKK
ncbi:UDP-N-acetylmuramate--L-alanine ligase [Anaerotruncus sp. 2789STDY5834896]|uniref:UDP-N-acetylmuramate--L-alanine ligase n=1 Tax=uncultured Anaerotruncus sp. TaxID=905011 RepID=A0A1C6K0L8_9FIRM|nr:UDP-N-acetylmuramate--L-alanine ligase [uncultured Anaerotruncus sp.]